MSDAVLQQVSARASQDLKRTIDDLCAYLRVPAISCEPEHVGDVRALAATVAQDLAALGFVSQVRDLEGALPLVAAHWDKAGPSKPTVLVYGHLDLQPAGQGWTQTTAHVPKIKRGRLYARGSADDMGGWMSHVAAIRAWQEVTGGLPCNLKLIVESEEEIGSPNLERFIDAYPQDFTADAMILTDCENPSTRVPGLTVSLRGLMEAELTVEVMRGDVHSGLWGNVVPDAATALCQAIAKLVTPQGRVQGALVEPSAAKVAGAQAVPISKADVRKSVHLLPGVSVLPLQGRSVGEWLWLQPAVTVVATTLPTASEKRNALKGKVSATLSIRLAPGQTPEAIMSALRHSLRKAPQGVKLTLEQRGEAGEGWSYDAQGPAFEAVDRAYQSAWGCKLARIGVGGSIPFVAMFARRFGDLPLILNGVMDPQTGAHGPDESMDLDVFAKSIQANIALYHELSVPGILK